VGNASGEGRPGLTGATAAAPLMFELQRRLAPAPWLTQPTLTMRRVQVCRDDGFLANDLCEAISEWVPAASHFERQSPYHQRVHLDSSARYRVDSTCERVASMQHAEARLYWHLDGRYIGTTDTFHQMSLDIAPGSHLVTLVDGDGNRLSRSFEVLGTHP
jgi:membrane carboxypeptidase/penicillin-binding protein PbpC